jgi:hypothetical protein
MFKQDPYTTSRTFQMTLVQMIKDLNLESISVRLNRSFYFWVFNFRKQDKKLQL